MFLEHVSAVCANHLSVYLPISTSPLFPVLAFASVKTKTTHSRAGTDATVRAFEGCHVFGLLPLRELFNATQYDCIEIRAFRRRALMPSLLQCNASLPASLAVIASLTLCWPFLPLTSLQSPLKYRQTRYYYIYIRRRFRNYPSRLVFCSLITPQPLAAQGLSMMSVCRERR